MAVELKSGSAGNTLASGVTLGLLASFTCPLHYLATVGFEVTVEMLKVYAHCMLDKPKWDLISSAARLWKT